MERESIYHEKWTIRGRTGEHSEKGLLPPYPIFNGRSVLPSSPISEQVSIVIKQNLNQKG